MSERKTLKIQFSHIRDIQEETWFSTSYYCMNCGTKSVWKSEAEDYYTGPKCMCIKCGFYWDVPIDPCSPNDSEDQQRWNELKIINIDLTTNEGEIKCLT